MKSIFIFSVLSLSPLFAQTADTAPSTSKTKPTSYEKRSSNEITFEIINHIKAIFATSATATDQESAKAAIKSINDSTQKILALKTILASTDKPTAEEKKQCAVQMLKFESEISEIVKIMSLTFDENTEEVNKLIEPQISKNKTNIAPTMTLINEYYPREEMLGYMNALKELK